MRPVPRLRHNAVPVPQCRREVYDLYIIHCRTGQPVAGGGVGTPVPVTVAVCRYRVAFVISIGSKIEYIYKLVNRIFSGIYAEIRAWNGAGWV